MLNVLSIIKITLYKMRFNLYYFINKLVSFRQHVNWGENISILGTLYIKNNGLCKIGDNCIINSSLKANPIGCGVKTCIRVGKKGQLHIGRGCKISNSSFICDDESIEIGDSVHIGSGCKFYATDFHSLNPYKRAMVPENPNDVARGRIKISDHAFIGANSFILKNVKIGKNSVIGAGSVVTKSVPDNEIWAGNPARKIRDLRLEELSE